MLTDFGKPTPDALDLQVMAGRRSRTMNTIEDLQDAVRQLSPSDLAAFRAWFAEFDAAAWNRQFEEDVAAGRLDRFAEEAIRDLREGRCTEL